MRVLFIGGTGNISSACVALALSRGMEVYVLNRGKRGGNLPEGTKTLVADIHDAAGTLQSLGSLSFDVVANFIAFVPADIERDIELFAGRTGQYVFISSASAYQKPPRHYVITEATPLENPFWEYSRNKIACEELLLGAVRDKRFPGVIVRPSLTFGDGMLPLSMNSWSHPWTLADRMLKGLPIVVAGDGTSLWQTTHNSDFAKGFVGLLGRVETIGEAFHITTDEVLTQNQHYESLAAVLGVKPAYVHLATRTIMAIEPSMEGGLLGDKAHSLVLDNSKIKRFVPEYKATTSFAEGIARSVAYMKADASRQGIDAGFNSLCDRLIAAQRRAITV